MDALWKLKTADNAITLYFDLAIPTRFAKAPCVKRKEILVPRRRQTLEKVS